MGMTILPRYYHGNGVRLYDRQCSNSGDGDSIHGSTAVAVTELMVDADDRAVIKLLWNECRMSYPCASTPTLRLIYLLDIEA